MKRSYLSLFTGALLCLFFAACAPGPDTQATATAAAAAEAQQQAVGTLSASILSTTVARSATQTALAAPTVTPTVTLTSTPTPTPTVTPGPLVIDDDFSSMNPRWLGCDICAVKDGALIVGPYPASNSAKGYITLCKDCGVVHEYKMSVDATYADGPSDRGFGFVLRENNGSFIDLEISTWQVYGVWHYDVNGGDAGIAWRNLLPGGFTLSTYLYPSQLTNHIEVEVKASQSSANKDLVKISFNGILINTVEIPSGRGRVGLTVGLHSISAAFDNFHFEAMP
jgi:hypothetical protein